MLSELVKQEIAALKRISKRKAVEEDGPAPYSLNFGSSRLILDDMIQTDNKFVAKKMEEKQTTYWTNNSYTHPYTSGTALFITSSSSYDPWGGGQ